MGEIIRNWLRTRLGVIIDLSPEIFGHYARDGTLLAKVLHSYDVINDNQLSTLVRTQDPALARVNLKHLRVWLKFIGVDCDNEWMEDISNGKGSMALRLFYKVFLCLENKDRLHFITLQKEREKYIPSSSKFDVTIVPEEPLAQDSSKQLLPGIMRRSTTLVSWQQKKYQDLIDSRRKDRDVFRPSQVLEPETDKTDEPEPEKTEVPGRKSSKSSRRKSESSEVAQRRELDEFAKKHRVKKIRKIEDSCEDIRRSPRVSKTVEIDEEAAKAFTKALKQKHRQERLMRSFKTRMQKNLLSDIWKEVLDNQEMEFDELVAKKVLHQSEYEKQLVRKLCDIRNQKSRMAANRGIVEKLLEETRESEMRLEQERAREVMVREAEEIEAERRRINELERRIEEQTKLRKQEKLAKFIRLTIMDIVDISTEAAEYKNATGEEKIPDSLWNQWMALFFKGESIIEAEVQFASKDNSMHEDIRDENVEDEARTRVLNDEDFNNYHHLKLPWKNFVPSIDEEVREYLHRGLVVLGFIVHKTLQSLNPQNLTEPVEALSPEMKTRSIVLGVPDSLLYDPIQQLLKNRKIHLVRVEEAINHCLIRYKEEMRNVEYIDLEMTTARERNSSLASETGDSGKKGRKVRVSSSGKSTNSSREKVGMSKSGVDKVTQTPHAIPHDDLDPSLSNAAFIGKWIHEFFTLGQPLSDELVSRTIVEYLRSLENVQGFVLVNYPNTRRQLICLEFALTGRRLPDSGDGLFGENGENLEEDDSPPSRISFYEGTGDSEDSFQRSRLLPDPTNRQYDAGESYFTSFVRIKPKPRESEFEDDDDIWEVIADDADSVDIFYVSKEIASVLYYTIFDLTTLKTLVRLAIAGKNELISRETSDELFGDYLEYFEERMEADFSASEAPIVRKLLQARSSDYSFGESQLSRSTESGLMTQPEKFSKSFLALPGHDYWNWVDFPQPAQVVQNLASLWKNLEISYIENLKDTFHLKRLNFSAIAPYRDLVAKYMKEFVNRPDQKQDLLHEFHRAYNDVDQEIREEVDVKRELHCRVEDFQAKLWEICDSRRREAEGERLRIINENWTADEMVNIANIYTNILQAELDRFNDTLQFVNDYYCSMLQRPLREIRSVAELKRIALEPGSSDSKQEIRSKKTESGKSVKEKESKDVKRSSVSQILTAPSPPEGNLFKGEIAKLLVDVDKEDFSPTQNFCYKSVESNIRFVENILESLASRILDNLKKEETRKHSDPRSESDIDKKKFQDLVSEWRYAFMYEANRLRVRLKVLESAARSDIRFLMESMRRLFSEIQKNINDRFAREVTSVDQMARTFRFAIEEERPIQEEMLLDGDRFLVRSNVLMFPDPDEIPPLSIQEEIDDSTFSVLQLARLYEIFLRSAPRGFISARSFVYILQDLLICENGAGEKSSLPSTWFEMRTCDVPRLVDELFGDVYTVDWREFIVYATNIEMPSLDEVVRDYWAFRKIDAKCQEFVTFEDFSSTPLWFFDGRMAEDDLTSPFNGTMGEKSDWSLLTKRTNLSGTEMDNEFQRTFRLSLIKRLLCEIFSYDSRKVNYVALLMAFCKDEEPEVGLAKALSLAIGNKVCSDWDEGEEYVRKLLENRKFYNDSELRKEAIEASRYILNILMEVVMSETEEEAIEDSIEQEKSETSKSSATARSKNSRSSSVLKPNTPEGKNRGLSVSVCLPTEDELIKSSQDDEHSIVNWLKFDVPQMVLLAMLPVHATQSSLLETGKSLRECLELVYLDLRDELSDEAGMILVHRFLHHDFIKKLLSDTSTFTTKHLDEIVDRIIHKNP